MDFSYMRVSSNSLRLYCFLEWQRRQQRNQLIIEFDLANTKKYTQRVTCTSFDCWFSVAHKFSTYNTHRYVPNGIKESRVRTKFSLCTVSALYIQQKHAQSNSTRRSSSSTTDTVCMICYREERQKRERVKYVLSYSHCVRMGVFYYLAIKRMRTRDSWVETMLFDSAYPLQNFTENVHFFFRKQLLFRKQPKSYSFPVYTSIWNGRNRMANTKKKWNNCQISIFFDKQFHKIFSPHHIT